jgi:GNAT superfamily N-acetyltransferase
MLKYFQSGKCENGRMALGTVRRATLDDIEELVRLRGVMFSALNQDIDASDWRGPSRLVLEDGIAAGRVIGGVVDATDRKGLCAGGLLTINRTLASPRFPRGHWGYVGSVAVDIGMRRQGFGAAVMQFLVERGRELNLERLELHATPDGDPVYRKLGFGARVGGEEMSLTL